MESRRSLRSSPVSLFGGFIYSPMTMTRPVARQTGFDTGQNVRGQRRFDCFRKLVDSLQPTVYSSKQIGIFFY